MQVFRGIPFLYELKALLDWSVTPTTLTLVDWLKLEDIRASLYNRQCDLMMRDSTRAAIGTPQPFASKFALGTLLSLLVIALLWTPLLAFSSSNPTFRIPAVTQFAFNVTIVYSTSDGVTRVPLFQSEHHSAVLPWLREDPPDDRPPLPPSLDAYSPPQLQMMCGSEDSDALWPVAPPLRQQLTDALAEAAASGSSAPRVWMEVGFAALRSLPPATAYGGPMCRGAARVPLMAASVQELRDVLVGRLEWAHLSAAAVGSRRNAASSVHGAGGSEGRGFIGWVWQLKEHKCQAVPANRGQLLGPEDAADDASGLPGWPGFEVCSGGRVGIGATVNRIVCVHACCSRFYVTDTIVARPLTCTDEPPLVQYQALPLAMLYEESRRLMPSTAANPPATTGAGASAGLCRGDCAGGCDVTCSLAVGVRVAPS